jgi:hypothetical protein
MLLVSIPDERNLRVIFPTPDIREVSIHVGFYHNDLQASFRKIIEAVLRGRFNILTVFFERERLVKCPKTCLGK